MKTISIIAFFLLIPHATVGADKYPACKAATEKVDYGEGLVISDSTRALIESYRSGWRDLCDPKGRRKPSLSELFMKAKQIEFDFSKVFDAFNELILNDRNFDLSRFTLVNDLVSKKYPAFVPAFRGEYGNEEFFSPSMEAFRQSSPLGNSEDRLFFGSRIPLDRDFPPFIRKTWDYGGCIQFGEFDWPGAMKSIARVKKQAANAAYLRETSLYEEKLFSEFAGRSTGICTCKAKESVMKDFLIVQKYLKTEPRFASYAPKIQQSIDSLNAGKIKVESEREKHCSGG